MFHAKKVHYLLSGKTNYDGGGEMKHNLGAGRAERTSPDMESNSPLSIPSSFGYKRK